jgi:hypothetical protein
MDKHIDALKRYFMKQEKSYINRIECLIEENKELKRLSMVNPSQTETIGYDTVEQYGLYSYDGTGFILSGKVKMFKRIKFQGRG